MVIRPALPSEAQDLAILGERLWRETYTGLIPAANLELHVAETFGLAQQAAEAADSAGQTMVIDQGGRLQGYARLKGGRPKAETEGYRAFHFVKPLEVVRFYVDRSLHGTGAATGLMAEVLSWAASQGHDGVWLQVWEQNPRAMRFYEKTGFSDAGATTFRIGHQVDRDRLLACALEP